MSTFEDKYRKWHTGCSYAKSGVRLIAAALAMAYHVDASYAILILAGGFFVAELIGILEEAI